MASCILVQQWIGTRLIVSGRREGHWGGRGDVGYRVAIYSVVCVAVGASVGFGSFNGMMEEWLQFISFVSLS